MKELEQGYTVEIDGMRCQDWSELIGRFGDTTIYQTWSYGSVRWGEGSLSHIVLKKNRDVVSAAQARILKLPVFGTGIAYVPSGPLWIRHGTERNINDFAQMVRALFREYVVERGLLLRIVPNAIENGSDELVSVLQQEGLTYRESLSQQRTFVLDLSLSMEELRKNLDPKWRNKLKIAEKSELTVIRGTEDALYEQFSLIYRDMHDAKGFLELVDINEIRSVQRELPDHLKMRIFICLHQNQPVSAAICAATGETAIYLLGATNEQGRKIKSSHLLQWRVVEWLKSRQCRWYDLGGVDRRENPGTYSFKAGLAGKTAQEVRYLGQFDACENKISSILIAMGDKLNMLRRKKGFEYLRGVMCLRDKIPR